MNRSHFVDEFRHSVDAKGRVQVPSSFRQQLSPESGGRFVLQRGRDRTIEVHPLCEWRAYWDRTLQNMPRYQERALRVRRFRNANAVEVEMDKAFRILVPKRLLEAIGVKDRMVLAGAGEYFELWEPGQYDAFIAEAGKRYDEDLVELERHGWGLEQGDERETGRGVSPSGSGK